MVDSPVTRAEHESLKSSVTQLADAVTRQGELFRDQLVEEAKSRKADAQAHREEMRDITSSIFSKLDSQNSKQEKERLERSKLPYPLLSLIFGVIITVGGGLTWNMSRIESDAKDGRKELDTIVQREMRLLDTTLEAQVLLLSQSLEKVSDQLDRSDRQFVDVQARLDERLKSMEMRSSR